MGDKPHIPDSGDIESVELKSALEERYLAYALSTIMHRALPDVRDGLKPVHRRLMFAMRQLKLDPGQGFKKCARVVGDVIGKFHPHGDQSVYEALVRLAQDFAQRYPLVDGQGNFGNIDGDSAAAMRYTEARLTQTAANLLDGLEENAVDFRTTYDGEDEEPIVLPAAFPNLLANGSNGIAVGMATSIPPHNAYEVINAARMVIANRDVTTRELMTCVPGPDFPTGGIIIDNPDIIHNAYETGRGGFRVRARWHKEEQGRGTYLIVITEIPYQVPKSRLVEKLAELITEKKLPLLEDVRDESTEDIRLVLEPKNRNVDADVLMESLFRLTELESRISLNMNVLARGQVPMVLSLREVLRQWLDHRREVLVRRSQHRLDHIDRRLEILGGYIIAYLNLDEVIRIIREEDEPKPILMATFALTDVQAEAILNMRLRSLRRLEEMELRREHDALSEERAQIIVLLDSEEKQWKTIDWELEGLAKDYGPTKPGCARRSTFGQAKAPDSFDVREAMVEREPVTVVLSEKGWIRAMKGHVQDLSGLTFKTDDKLHHALLAETTDTLLVFATNGKVFSLDPSKLPGGRGAGEPLRLMVDLEQGAEIIDVQILKPGTKLLLATRGGRGFVVPSDDCAANTRKGKQVLNVEEGDAAQLAVPVSGDMVAVVGDNRRLLLFPLDSVPVMSRGKGVRLFKFREGGIADLRTFERANGFGWTDSAGRSFNIDNLAEYIGDRGTVGRMVPRGFPKSGKFTG